jgi:hypothetical protein
MMTKTEFRIVRPGQWVLAKHNGFKGLTQEVGDLPFYWLSMVAEYGPERDWRDSFGWYYRPVVRRANEDGSMSSYEYDGHQRYAFDAEYYKHKDAEGHGGYYVRFTTWDLDLIDFTWSNRWSFDQAESKRYREGKGAFVYEPARPDDAEACPGPDISLYACDQCGRETQEPYCDDQGVLLCPSCDKTGLVYDRETAERLDQVREFARKMGLLSQLEHKLAFLNHGFAWGKPTRTNLGYDFAPHSFAWCEYFQPQTEDERKKPRFCMNGGLIYHGPGSPGDGGFPALSVSLSNSTGWSIHT